MLSTMATIAQIISKQRESLGLSQEELARKVGANRSVVSRWENGKSIPDVVYLSALGEVLGVSTNELRKLRTTEKEANKQIRERRFGNLIGEWEDWQKSFVARNKIISSRVEISFRNNSLRYKSEFLIDGHEFELNGKCWHKGNSLAIDAKEGPNGREYGERAFMLYDMSTVTQGYILGQAIGATSFSGFTPTQSPSLLWKPPSGSARLAEISNLADFESLDFETKNVLQERMIKVALE